MCKQTSQPAWLAMGSCKCLLMNRNILLGYFYWDLNTNEQTSGDRERAAGVVFVHHHIIYSYMQQWGSQALPRPTWIKRNKRADPTWIYLLVGIFKTNVGNSVGHFKCVWTRGGSPVGKETAAMTPTEKLSHPQHHIAGHSYRPLSIFRAFRVSHDKIQEGYFCG